MTNSNAYSVNTKQSFGDNNSLDDLAYAFMTKDGVTQKKPKLKIDMEINDPARDAKINSKWARVFFPAEAKRKKRQIRMEKEVGQDLTGEYNPLTNRNRRRSEMYNNPFPWIAKSAQMANKGKNKFIDLKDKMRDRVNEINKKKEGDINNDS